MAELLLKNKILGEHKIEGIGDEFVPKIIERDRDLIDDIILINDEDAINMARILARKYGLGVGISSGANMIAGILLKQNGDVINFVNGKLIESYDKVTIDEGTDITNAKLALYKYNEETKQKMEIFLTYELVPDIILSWQRH